VQPNLQASGFYQGRPIPKLVCLDALNIIAHERRVDDRVRLNTEFNRTRTGSIVQVYDDGWLCVHWDVEGLSAVHSSNVVKI
jgi:hypothetical protein